MPSVIRTCSRPEPSRDRGDCMMSAHQLLSDNKHKPDKMWFRSCILYMRAIMHIYKHIYIICTYKSTLDIGISCAHTWNMLSRPSFLSKILLVNHSHSCFRHVHRSALESHIKHVSLLYTIYMLYCYINVLNVHILRSYKGIL